MINSLKNYCYRICHISNLAHILAAGLCTKHHPQADPDFVSIGNPGIIDTRDTTPVRIDGYGNIGDYVPFYFTPRSIMLYNIVTGYRAPMVQKFSREKIIIIRCQIPSLAGTGRFFFTDGQANDALTNRYNDVTLIDRIDWQSIQSSNFRKTDDDFDRPRRYQAEFLIYNHVPFQAIESIIVYNQLAGTFVQDRLAETGLKLNVLIEPIYFFD